jgi:hypothetical protein
MHSSQLYIGSHAISESECYWATSESEGAYTMSVDTSGDESTTRCKFGVASNEPPTCVKASNAAHVLGCACCEVPPLHMVARLTHPPLPIVQK